MSRQWLGLALVAAAMAVATVAVPPLITPHHGTAPAPSPATGVGAVSAASSAPISIQAEDPGNRLTGGASAVACATCRGGHRVRYLCAECRLEVRADLPSAGPRTITVYYEVDGPRKLKVSIDGGLALSFDVDGPGWTTPRSFSFTAPLPAGEVSLALYNDDSPAPDLDEIVIA